MLSGYNNPKFEIPTYPFSIRMGKGGAEHRIGENGTSHYNLKASSHM
jgi:hypothetical protein